MNVLLAISINGVAVGAIYALLATGFNLLLLVVGVIQFAYPHLVVLSMYILWMILKATGDNLAISLPATIAASVGLNLATEPMFRPLVERRSLTTSFVLSIGIMIMVTDIMQRQLNGGVPIGFPVSLTGKDALLRIGLATMTVGQILTIATGITAVIGLWHLLHRTQLGRSFRAMTQSHFTARLLGIPVNKMSIGIYSIAGLLGGMLAILLAMTLGAASAPLATNLALKMLAVAIFAGLGNLRGGLICGVVLGLVESYSLNFLPGDWTNAIALGMVMGAVMFKPEGVFSLRT